MFRVGFRVSEVGGADEESHAGANDVTRVRGSWLEAAPVARAAARGGERRELLQHLAQLGVGVGLELQRGGWQTRVASSTHLGGVRRGPSEDMAKLRDVAVQHVARRVGLQGALS